MFEFSTPTDSDTNCLELVQTPPQVKGSLPQDCPPQPSLQMPFASSGSPGYSQLLSDLAINRGSRDSLLRFDRLLEQLTKLRETHFLVCYTRIIKNVVIDTEKYPDEEVQARVLSTGAFIPMKLECRYVHQPGSFPHHMLLGFLWKFHHIHMING